MDFRLTDHQEMLFDAARKISEKHTQPGLAARDARLGLVGDTAILVIQ